MAYKDNVIPRPTSDAEFELVLKIAGAMNSWLKDFIDQEYVGAEYEELLKAYKSGAVKKDVAALRHHMMPGSPVATLSFWDMHDCPFLLCNFFQKGVAKNNANVWSSAVSRSMLI